MKKFVSIFTFAIVGALVVSCGEVPAEKREALDGLLAKNDAVLNRAVTGDISIAELTALVKENQATMADLKASGLSTMEAVTAGATGGVLGRSAIHLAKVGARFIPGPWGLLVDGLASLLLGGSAGLPTKRKEEGPKV